MCQLAMGGGKNNKKINTKPVLIKRPLNDNK
jgi:hypothetical protein